MNEEEKENKRRGIKIGQHVWRRKRRKKKEKKRKEKCIDIMKVETGEII